MLYILVSEQIFQVEYLIIDQILKQTILHVVLVAVILINLLITKY